MLCKNVNEPGRRLMIALTPSTLKASFFWQSADSPHTSTPSPVRIEMKFQKPGPSAYRADRKFWSRVSQEAMILESSCGIPQGRLAELSPSVQKLIACR
jgi:hypothetical protein